MQESCNTKAFAAAAAATASAAARREVLGTDVFGLGMRRLVQILDGGGNPGDFERLEWLYYGKRRGGAGSGLLDVIFGAE